ncbi:retron Ec67 family RNA-directed DNA polymerase/endonuclease [Abiotrophia defectiva]|uniref:retron Ec67 family RNA-directed DNA polymerase/endonuclease n=1 Tax=Abiotrophia defectiva TaxID=46125 RepID=UPI0028E7AC31|nr:retron Ec67 family RNA-directed DNA polymerase/endonuclease [Abiotrophia defectiva]
MGLLRGRKKIEFKVTRFEFFDRRDFADSIDVKVSQLCYLLYKKKVENCYVEFPVDKKNGEKRQISAPSDDLKYIQRRVATLLQERLNYVNKKKRIDAKIAHGFVKGKCIKTNASPHRGRRYLLNVDLKDFFDSIHFGRVKGFFEKNKDFAVPEVAVVIAQIACYGGKLPQGAPTSPIISNLICQIMDIKIAKLCKKYRLMYTRYADDLTFSTNDHRFIHSKKRFLVDLRYIIETQGFEINMDKVRFQDKEHRQSVTGLVVNNKINVPKEYYKKTRSMAYALYSKGSFEIEGKSGSIRQLEGRFAYINDIERYNNREKKASRAMKVNQHNGPRQLSIREKDYQKFLFYKYFWGNEKPLIITEGKTDPLYLKAALKRLHSENAKYSGLISQDITFRYKIKFFEATKRLEYFFDIKGSEGQGNGSGNATAIYKHYKGNEKERIQSLSQYFGTIDKSNPEKKGGAKKPVILLFDNELGQKDKPLDKFIKAICKGENNVEKKVGHIEEQLKNKYYHNIQNNLYLVTLPKKSYEGNMDIEALLNVQNLDSKWIPEKFDGRKFSEDAHSKKRVSKNELSQMILKNYKDPELNFKRFEELFEVLEKVVNECEKSESAQ